MQEEKNYSKFASLAQKYAKEQHLDRTQFLYIMKAYAPIHIASINCDEYEHFCASGDEYVLLDAFEKPCSRAYAFLYDAVKDEVEPLRDYTANAG